MDLPLDEQLKQLEDLYAECLMEGMDPNGLTRIWEQIKAIRQQLQAPIYDHLTPPDLQS